VKGSKFESLWVDMGRSGQQGIDAISKSKQVEVLDLESGKFQSFTPFSQASKIE